MRRRVPMSDRDVRGDERAASHEWLIRHHDNSRIRQLAREQLLANYGYDEDDLPEYVGDCE